MKLYTLFLGGCSAVTIMMTPPPPGEEYVPGECQYPGGVKWRVVSPSGCSAACSQLFGYKSQAQRCLDGVKGCDDMKLEYLRTVELNHCLSESGTWLVVPIISTIVDNATMWADRSDAWLSLSILNDDLGYDITTVKAYVGKASSGGVPCVVDPSDAIEALANGVELSVKTTADRLDADLMPLLAKTVPTFQTVILLTVDGSEPMPPRRNQNDGLLAVLRSDECGDIAPDFATPTISLIASASFLYALFSA